MILANRYSVVKSLGEGGFAKTFLAEDKLRGGKVVLKLLEASSGAARDRELKTLKSLYHPHVVEVLGSGVLTDEPHRNAPFLVLEYVEGKTFDRELSWDVFAQVCRTISYLHDEGVTHGDLKPSNILVSGSGEKRTVKLIDFGLSESGRRANLKTAKERPPAGTLAYMAPEVLTKGQRAPESDLYALGILLHQLVHSGHLPFPLNAEAALHFHLGGEDLRRGLAPEGHPWKTVLDRLFARLLAPDPSKRPTDALEILTVLNRDAGAKLPVHRGWEKTGDEAIFFQELGDYLGRMGDVLSLPAAATPRSFLDEERARLEKYAATLKRLNAPGTRELSERLAETRMRLAIQQGDYKTAAASDGASDALRNVKALALIYTGDHSAAGRILKTVAKGARAGIDRARALNYLGLSAYNQNQLKDAASLFEESLAAMKKEGETAGVVSNAMNLGAIHQRQGHVAEALKSYGEALKAAETLQNSYLLAMLLSNLANLHLSVGSLDEGEAALDRSQELAESLGMPLLKGYNLLLQADAAAWRGQSDRVEDLLETARKHFEDFPSSVYEENIRFRLQLLKIHRQIAGRSELPGLSKKIDALEKEFGGDPKSLFQIKAVRARLALTLSDLALCTRLLEELKAAFEDERKTWPIAYRARAAEAPRFAVYFETEEALRTAHKTPADASLWKLVDINRRIVSERDTDKLVEVILDASLDLTGAERGFLIMPEYGKWKRGTWKVKAARHFRTRELPGGKDQLSQTVVQRVLESEGQKPLLIHDAQSESDLSRFKSVQALKLRSILACPIVVHREILGALYLDHSRATRLFREEDARLVKALADQAGLALTNARLYQDALRREKALSDAKEQLAEANKRLEEELAKKTDWADTIEEELKKLQEAGPVVGRSSVMKHIVSQIPILTKQRRAVLLAGEHGVGKDFIAKVLHQNAGGGPFTHEIGSKFPRHKSSPEGREAVEKLLRLAPDGCLYLDEITDIPLAYQRDLLPLIKGTHPFVILSTRGDPKEAVKNELILPEILKLLSGTLIRIPPLRERREDIAPLVQKFMRELSDERGLHRGIKKAAMGVLVEYDWPGNVHELKLEVERAVLSSQTSVTPTDLSPAVLGESGFLPGSFKKDAPELQDQRAQFERDYILQALETCGNNKIRAAKKLGLSRAMLYVKLKKYGIPLR